MARRRTYRPQILQNSADITRADTCDPRRSMNPLTGICPARARHGLQICSPDVELTSSEVPPLPTGLLSLPEHSGRGVALSYRAFAPAGAGIWNRTCAGVSSGVAVTHWSSVEIPPAHCVRLRNGARHRIRQGEKMGGGESWRHLRPADAGSQLRDAVVPIPPPIFSLLTPYAAHHSARRAASSGTSSEETCFATVRWELKIRHKNDLSRVR